MKLAIVTPTRNRLYTLALLHKYISRQTRQPDLWIIATDGEKPEFPNNSVQTIISTADYAGSPIKSFTSNLMRSIDIAEKNDIDAVLMMEDDDWYGAEYVERMAELLRDADVGAFTPFRELRVISGEQTVANMAPLAQISFKKEVFSVFKASVEKARATDSFKVDHIFWENIKRLGVRSNRLEQSNQVFCLKGIYFRKKDHAKGLTAPHQVYRRTLKGYALKILHSVPPYQQRLRLAIFKTLRDNIGEDAEAYKAIIWGKSPTESGEFL